MTYKMKIRIPIGGLLKSVKDLEDSVNNSMKGFGFDEKMTVTSVIDVDVTVSRALTNEEIARMTGIAQATYKEKFGYAEVESFELQY